VKKALHFLIVAATLASGNFALAGDWEKTAVPGMQSIEGYAWYRAWVKPHASFFNKHERDLFGESVVLNVRDLAGAHEVFVNGRKVGGGGRFPPVYVDGLKGNHQYKVPSGTLVKDAWNEIAFKVYNPVGKGGFLGEAPFIMNYFQECVLAGEWEFLVGEEVNLERKARTVKPKVGAFENFRESNRVLGRAEKLTRGDKLTPNESLAKMRVPDDLQVELLLHEPLVAQPTHLSFDERGRLWIAQYRQYPYPAGLKMISRDRYYRSRYDKVPPAPPNQVKGVDRITIHEDTDGDGRYDKHKTFQAGLNLANAALRGRGGTWVMNVPYLLFYPDVDFNDVPDGPPVVHLQGFGLEDTHAVANGLTWGMDGWLYGVQGSTNTCRITRPGLDPSETEGLYYRGCMTWRYHPETRRFEFFSEGGGNNFGLEVDAAGRLFTGHNGGETRGWHFLQGGRYLMQGRSPNKYGPPRHPYAFGDLPKMRSSQPVRRFTHFAAVAEGTAIPARYQGHFFAVDPLHNFVMASGRSIEGSTFSTSDLTKALQSDDFAFRPVYLTNAPDGSLLVADFYEHYVAHGQHYQSQIDPDTGRVYRLRGKKLPREKDRDLSAKSTSELIGLLKHPNKWHRHMAVRLLGDQKDGKGQPALRKLVKKGGDREALCALWAHYQAFGLDDELAISALGSKYPPLRMWAVRLACDDIGFSHKHPVAGLRDHLGGKQNPKARLSLDFFQRLLAQARVEPYAETRSQMAASARRLPADQALSLTQVLLTHDEDMDDPFLPLMLWWALDAQADHAREELLTLFEDASFMKLPMVERHVLPRILRRFALQGRRQDLLACARLLRLATDKAQTKKLLEGFEKAYQGRLMQGLPQELVEALAKVGRSSLMLRLRLGEPEAMTETLAKVADRKTPKIERLALVRSLGELKKADAVPVLLSLAFSEPPEPTSLAQAALAALSAFPDGSIGRQATARLPTLPKELASPTFELLLAREAWTKELLSLMSQGKISPASLPPDIAQRLREHPTKNHREAASRLFKKETEVKANLKEEATRIESVLAKRAGNPYAGEVTYAQRCAACHKLFHKGGAVGPNLTSYQRDDLGTLLPSILDPNLEIREGFAYVSVSTTDGRTLAGFLADNDAQVATLRIPNGENVRLPRKEIKVVTPMGRSLMPAGLLAGLTEKQLQDFFAYLRISQPILR
jgi:putative membrane-bound dehydrogenase-like protein